MIKISIKNGDLDGALKRLTAAKKEENRAFDEKVAAYFAPKRKDEPTVETAKGPAPTYASILARSRRVS